MVRSQINHKNIHSYEATAYHEAGHAIVMLLLGYQLNRVEIIAPGSGITSRGDGFEDYFSLVSSAFKKQGVNPKLIRYWLDSFLISDSGAIFETEFNLVSDKDLKVGSLSGRHHKIELFLGLDNKPHVLDYFRKYIFSQD